MQQTLSSFAADRNGEFSTLRVPFWGPFIQRFGAALEASLLDTPCISNFIDEEPRLSEAPAFLETLNRCSPSLT